MKPDLYNDTQRLLLLMLSLQCVFIIIFIMFSLSPGSTFVHGFFNLNVDRNIGETFQYVQEIWIIALLMLLIARTRNYHLLYWPATFLVFLADDSFKLHEVKSVEVARMLSLDSISQSHHWLIGAGQGITLVAVSIVFLGVLIVIYRFGDREFRRVSRGLVFFLAIVAFFAIGVDAAHHFSTDDLVMRTLSIIEEGGEMVTTSFIVWYLYGQLPAVCGAARA